jgi:NDP-sugar pyrophosphorylase family protein
MQIVIPMSGTGQRFAAAGYQQIKPLIPVDGKPMIEHVVSRFPGAERFVFICNRVHLEESQLEETLLGLQPTASIVAIEPHKLGPVHAVSQAVDHIDDALPTIVNYCDFSWSWDYADFKEQMSARDCDGCVPAYIGFHPHLLGPSLYAGMRADEALNMLEIREKHSFTANTMDCHQSSGTYYFKRGSYIRDFFRKLEDSGDSINGEYYVSTVMQLMKEAGLSVAIYELDHFLQWGTPQDLQEYQYWSEYFRHFHAPEGEGDGRS